VKRVFVIVGTLLLLVGGAAALTASAAYTLPGNSLARQTPGNLGLRPVVTTDIKHDRSPSLRAMRPIPLEAGPREVPLFELPAEKTGASGVVDKMVQRTFGPLAMPTPIVSFDGIYNYFGPIPPDTNGDVGPHHYVQSVNSGFQVWDKTGVSLFGPVNINTLWTGFGGFCESYNNGDPVTLYDPLADRWLISQFAFASQSGPTYECIAISTSSDPTGSYHRYAFLSGPTNFQDYPHLGVWPDGYYMATNEFGAPSGGGYFAYERTQMLAGATARQVYFHQGGGGHLPSDLDGPPPPAGSPNYFLRPSSGAGQLQEFKFHVDWTNPANSTLSGPFTITVSPYNSTICTATRGQCIDQPNTTAKLESLAGRLMHRLAYRNMGTHEVLIASHTVNASATTPGIAGVRWYEIRDPNGTAATYQQGTYAPNDNTHRFMGSAAMDRVGNIGIGFSASSTTRFPSVVYAGRLVTDPLNELSQGEATLHEGTGSEDFPAAPRWGDYSNISVDPADDCTFWFTTEYFRTTGLRNWRTRIGSFRFPNCTGGGQVTATPQATSTATRTQTPCPMNFTDVAPTDYFYEPVRYLFCNGVISGYNTSPPCAAGGIPCFNPYANTTRGQMAKIVVRGFGVPLSTNTTPIFSDVPPTNPFFVEIQTAAENNIVSGYADGTYRPNTNVTRGQLSKIVVVAASIMLGWDIINPTTPHFSDVPQTNPFYTFIETAFCHGIISGYADGTFRWGADATRGQIAKIVYLAILNQGTCSSGGPTRTSTAVVPTVTRTPTPLPTLCPGGQAVSGSITTSDPVQTGRVGLGSPVSSCAVPKACSGLSDSLARHYDSYTYTNTSSSTQCITVRISQACGDNAVQSLAYLGSYDPANLCTNYLADGGASGQTFSYSFNVGPGATYVIVVVEVSPNIGCTLYDLRVSPCAGVATVTPVPTNTQPPPTNTGTPTNTATPGLACAYTVATATATFIAGVNNNIGNACDDCSTNVDLPFPVSFYGSPVNQARLGSNGMVQFNSSNVQDFYYSGCLPIVSGDDPYDRTLFVYYDDLMTVPTGTVTCTACGIYTATFGTAPNRTFVVRWNTAYFNRSGEANFELLLTEGSNVLSAIYGANANNGADAVAGVQLDETSGRFTQFSCLQPVLTPGLRLNYSGAGCNVPPIRRN
jgi:hypothetical protein